MADQKIENWEEVVKEFSKNGESKVVLKVGCYRGKPFIDLRTYFQPDGEEDFVMTKKGVRLHAESIPDLKQGLSESDAILDAFYDKATAPKKSSKRKAS